MLPQNVQYTLYVRHRLTGLLQFAIQRPVVDADSEIKVGLALWDQNYIAAICTSTFTDNVKFFQFIQILLKPQPLLEVILNGLTVKRPIKT